MGVDQKALANAAARTHFNLFVRRAFQQLLPATEFQPNWHIDAICHALERVAAGEIRRLIITLPPRHLKSTIASAAFPAFLLGRNPSTRIVTASYVDELSVKQSSESRQIMESPWYAQMFPGTVIRPDQNRQHDFHTTRNGFRLATSVGGSLTGFGGDILIIDDPMKAEDARSATKRQAAIEWFRHTAATRLDNPKTGAIVLIQQRLHEEDLAGVLLDGGGWEHLNLPAIAEEPSEIEIGHGRVWRREIGEVLHEARMSRSDLDSKRIEVGSLHFAAQYQQRPGPAGGEIVKWAWFPRYVENTLSPRLGDAVIQSWDFAFTVAESSDYSVCLTFLYRDGTLYLMDVVRRRMMGPELVNFIPQHVVRWKASTVLIEAAGISVPLCQTLLRMNRKLYQIAVPKGDKESRLAGWAHLIEQGRVHLPEEAPWLRPLQLELEYFPNGKYKDQADALSQSLKWLNWITNRPTSRVTIAGARDRLVSYST